MNATGTQKRDPIGIGKQGKVWQVSLRWRRIILFRQDVIAGPQVKDDVTGQFGWRLCRLGDEVHEVSSKQIKEDLLYFAKEFWLLCQCFPKCFYENTGYVKC